MKEAGSSLLVLINDRELDIQTVFRHGSDIPVSLYTEARVIDILLNFAIADPYELDYFLNLLYSIFREKVSYTVEINVLYTNTGKYDDGKFSALLKSSEYKILPSSYESNGKYDATYYEPLKLKDGLAYKSENKQKEYEYKKFKISAVGGTFDHLHDGHKILLALSAFLTSTKLIVGLTSEKLLANKKFKEYLEDFEIRKENVLKFVTLLDPALSYDILPINDVCGPTGYEPNIEALIVSQETKSGGDFVNTTRHEKGLSQLFVFVVNVLGGKEKLSSTYLRQLASQNKN